MSPGTAQKPDSQWSVRLRRWLGAGMYPILSRWIDPSRQYSQVVYARLVAELVPDGAVWLDAGCGHQVFKLSSGRDEAEIVARVQLAIGCDLGWQALLAHRILTARVCADLFFFFKQKTAYEIMTLNYVAEHLEEPEKTFAEMARLLRPEGMLVVLTPNSLGYFVRLTRLGRKFLPDALVRKFILLREFRSPQDIFPTFYRANTRNDLVRQMEQAGLREVSFRMIKDPAVFSFVAPLAALELLFGRLLSLLGLTDLEGGTIIGVYRRTSAHLGCSGERGNDVTPSADALCNSHG